jgi:RNA polymerase sigma-70 factor (ECF subfamily)
MNDVDELLPTRRSLLGRLKNLDDQDSWKVFFDTYWKLIYNAALKSGLTESEAQDVVQETIVAVCKSISRFEYDDSKGSFKSWLLRQTRWRIADQFRKREPGIDAKRKRVETSTRTGTVERVADPASLVLEENWDTEWERNLMDVALEHLKRNVDPKHYQAYDLCAMKGWPVTKAARFLGLSSGNLYLIKHRLTKLLKKEVERLQDKPF